MKIHLDSLKPLILTFFHNKISQIRTKLDHFPSFTTPVCLGATFQQFVPMSETTICNIVRDLSLLLLQLTPILRRGQYWHTFTTYGCYCEQILWTEQLCSPLEESGYYPPATQTWSSKLTNSVTKVKIKLFLHINSNILLMFCDCLQMHQYTGAGWNNEKRMRSFKHASA